MDGVMGGFPDELLEPHRPESKKIRLSPAPDERGWNRGGYTGT
jgi:hypothetical protein